MAVQPEPFARGRAQPHRATPGRARSRRFIWSAALLFGAPLVATGHSFPYVPTQIFTPDACFNQTACHGPEVAYIFTQDSDDNVRLLSLNISSRVAADAAKLTPVTTSLPFLDKDNPKNTAFGAVRTEEGAVLVYAGECDQGPGDVWTYGEGAASGASGSAAWVKHATTLGKSQKSTSSSRGPYFLGGTIAFSGTLAPLLDEPTIYSYGGMCDTPSDSSKDWQSAANYTTGMMTLTPADNSPSSKSYAQDTTSNSGPKTPIAGFSLTALQSSMSNNSGTVTQQTTYVIIGGHTKQAFINMSTAAVWNLPEESWSYVNVQQSTDSPDGVESRSGHTAILSQDGRSVIVLGGWVGDVTNAAEPQLAILEMGQAYDSWRWTIPKQQPDFGDSGIYGHGAAILPGNIMIVYGGWQISDSDSSTSKVKRQSDITTAPQFLNLTDMTWAATYSNPTPAEVDGKNPHAIPNTAADSAKSKILGLSIGFGVGGGLVLLGLVMASFFCWRKRQRRRAAREETIRAMAQDASMFIHDSVDIAEREDVFPWGYRSWYTGGQDPYHTGGNDRSVGYENLRGSYGGYAPVVPGVARKPMSRQLRGGYVPANAQLNSFVSTPGQIHPIMEDDEEDPAYQRAIPAEATTPTSDAYSDPFLTPTVAVSTGGLPVFQPPPPGQSTAGPSTDGPLQHDPDVQDWVSDVDAADAMLARYNSTRQTQGRASPTRRSSQRSSGAREDDLRTESGLSESNRSAADGLGRSSSGRWSAIMATAGLFGSSSVPTTEPGKPGSSSSSSYNTAKSGFGALQAEGPNLLLGRTTPSSPFEDDEMQPSSPSKSKPPRRSWLGSLRRVFSGSESTSGDLSVRDRSPQREISTDMLSHDYEPPLAALGSELLRRKQGRQDWENGEGSGAVDRENEWDIERAVENRLVQVMFTVPKERLRVVNADDLDDGTSTDERQPLHMPQTAELVDMDKRSSMATASLRSGSKLSSHHDDEGGGVPVDAGYRDDGFLRVNQYDYEERSDGSERGEMIDRPLSVVTDMSRSERPISIATDVSFARSASVYTAEALTFERPKTRVLQMVDRIESQGTTASQETSPSISRAGTPGIRSVKSKKSLRSEDLRRQ